MERCFDNFLTWPTRVKSTVNVSEISISPVCYGTSSHGSRSTRSSAESHKTRATSPCPTRPGTPSTTTRQAEISHSGATSPLAATRSTSSQRACNHHRSTWLTIVAASLPGPCRRVACSRTTTRSKTSRPPIRLPSSIHSPTRCVHTPTSRIPLTPCRSGLASSNARTPRS